MTIIKNSGNDRVVDALRNCVIPNSKLDIASTAFSLFAIGFRVLKLDSTNIRAWDFDRENISETLLNSVEHIKPDRTEDDVLFELLLKLGLELTVPIEPELIAGKRVHSIGMGALFVRLASQIGHKEIAPVALGIAAWHKELAPAGETRVVFRDSAYADDVAKTNVTAIKQHGLESVRSL
jgi:adenine-specific DNA-methyltransferase